MFEINLLAWLVEFWFKIALFLQSIKSWLKVAKSQASIILIKNFQAFQPLPFYTPSVGYCGIDALLSNKGYSDLRWLGGSNVFLSLETSGKGPTEKVYDRQFPCSPAVLIAIINTNSWMSLVWVLIVNSKLNRCNVLSEHERGLGTPELTFSCRCHTVATKCSDIICHWLACCSLRWLKEPGHPCAHSLVKMNMS